MPRRPLCRPDDLAAAPTETVLRVPVFSAQLGLRRWCGVWLPPDYQPRRRHPVTYLFRGHHREWFHPQEDASRQKPLAQQVGQAVRAGNLQPTVLISPCFGSDDRKFHTIGANWFAPFRCPDAPGVGLGRFGTHFLEELRPTLEEGLGIDEPYRVAIGFSLGGLNALQLALRHPGLFQEVAAYDGSFFHDPPRRDDGILANPMFDCVFDKPRLARLVKTHSPIWLARNLPYSQLERSRYYLQSGPAASEPHDSNYERTRALADALAERNLTNEVELEVQDGSHNWLTADRFAMDILLRTIGAA